MKSVIAMMFAMPVIAFGGSTCFQAVTVVPSPVPQILCLTSLQETNFSQKLNVISSDEDMPKTLTVTSIIPYNENRVKFVSEAPLAQSWDTGCGAGVDATLNVSGDSRNGEIDVKALKLSATIRTANDTCHSTVYTDVVEYAVIK